MWGDGGGGECAVATIHWASNQPGTHQQAEGVEDECDHDLIHIEPGVEGSSWGRPECPGKGPTNHGRHDHHRAWCKRGLGDQPGSQRPQIELTFCPDTDHIGPEHDGHPRSNHKEGHQVGEYRPHSGRISPGPLHQVAGNLGGVCAPETDNESGHNQAQGKGE